MWLSPPRLHNLLIQVRECKMSNQYHYLKAIFNVGCVCVCVFFFFFLSRYSIDRNTDLERFFNVDAMSGVISTAKSLDREANSVHNLTIFAMESRKFASSQSQNLSQGSNLLSSFPKQQLSIHSQENLTRLGTFVKLWISLQMVQFLAQYKCS